MRISQIIFYFIFTAMVVVKDKPYQASASFWSLLGVAGVLSPHMVLKRSRGSLLCI